MPITNEILSKLIDEQIKDSLSSTFFKRLWVYEKKKLLVCEFGYKNVGFGIDVAPVAESGEMVSLTLCWRKPYDIYLFKSKCIKIIHISKLISSLDEIVKKAVNYITENSHIKISIIVPVYNRAKTLSRLIDSFKSQTLPKDQFEIIYVDDNSSDNSIDVINENSKGLIYSILKSPIQSGNASQPRNIGIMAARGIYTFFVDSDDYLDKDCMLNSYNMAVRNKSDIVYVKCDSTGNGRSLKSRLWKGLNNVGDADIFSNYLLLNFYSFKLFKTILLRKNNIFFDKSLTLGEDQAFLVSALCKADKVSILKDKSYYFLTTEDEVEHLSKTKESFDNLYKKWVFPLANIINVDNLEKKKKLYNCLLFRFVKKYSSNFERLSKEHRNVITSVLNAFRQNSELFDDSLVYDDGKEGLSFFSFNVLENKKTEPTESQGNPIVGIMNFHFANNFGAVLVPFALLTVISRLGFNTEIINYAPKEIPPRKDYVEFRRKFLNISSSTRLLKSQEELFDYQNRYSKIVVGSDQVWRLFNTSTYMLDYAHGNKTLISYAASFGSSDFNKLPNKQAISLLNRFDAISVRENTGVDICNNQFGLAAMQVLDPTLLLSIDDYQAIIDHFKPQLVDGKYVAYSIINKSNKEYVPAFVEKMEQLMNIKFKSLLSKYSSNEVNSVGGWLNDIKNSSFVITDSFHATVFSIIYRKKFVCLVTGANGTDRIPSLLKMLDIDISSRIVDSLDKISPELFDEEIDYDKVFSKLKAYQERSIMFLKNALNKPSNYKMSLK